MQSNEFTFAHIKSALSAAPASLSIPASVLIGMAKQDAAAIYGRALDRCTVKGPDADRFMSMLEASPLADESPLLALKRRFPMPHLAKHRCGRAD